MVQSSNNLLLRVVTAAVLIPLVFVLVLWAPQQVFAVVMALVAVLTMHEYLGLADKSRLAPVPYFCYLAVALMAGWPSLTGGTAALLVLLALVVVVLPWRGLEYALPGAAASAFGVLYVGLPLAMLVQMRLLPNGRQWLIYVLVLTWISDTAAYFTGRVIGGRKLAPRISPGKTWAGTIGSVIAAMLFGVLYARYVTPDYPLAWSIPTAVAVNLAGQLGDLAESALKRGAGVKDSSTLLPGHGGLLDRIDALLFAVPALWYILLLRTGRFFVPLP
jgi:phosphatidate cytidylyltransferase